MKKFVIRQYWTEWVDIPVEAENLEEAFALAHDKYSQGDYEEEPCNYEDTETMDVTGWYDYNKIPY